MKDRNKIYLDKVIEYLVRDTEIDYGNGNITTPFPFPFSSTSFFRYSLFLSSSFTSYCKEVYGLTEDEVKYVWKEYKSIIKDKIY